MATPLSEEQVQAIYRETIDPLYRFVSWRCGGDRQCAEDITQETWMRAIRAWRADGIPARPIAWLTTVARNLLLNQRRQRQHRSLDAVPPALLAAAAEPDEAPDSAEIAATVSRALALLPAPQARLLEAFHYDRRRVADLASSLGLSERAVEGRLRRAREKLRRVMEATAPEQGDL